jgi:hypothetical protein
MTGQRMTDRLVADDFYALQARLGQWDARRRQTALLLWLPRALAAALLAALVVALAARVRPLLTTGEIALLAVALAGVAALVTTVATLARRRSPAEQARFADRHFALRERAAAAVEIQAGQHNVSPALAARQLRDTLAAAEAVDVARQLPLTSRPADWLPVLAALTALALALWLPNPQAALLAQRRAVAAAVDQQAAALAGLSEQIAADASLSAEQREALQQPLEEALTTLAEPGVSQAEAVAALSQAETELRELGQTFDHAATSASVAAAADALSRSPAAGELAQALQEAQAAQAAQAAGELADALPQLDAAAQRELAASLAEAAAALDPADAALAEQLDRAAEALVEGDTAAAQEALREASAGLQTAAQTAAAAQQAAQTADQLGTARQSVASAGAPESAAQAGGEQAGQAGESGQSGEAGQEGESGQSGAAGQAGGAGETAGGQGQGSATGGPSPGGGHVENVFVPAPVDLSGQGQAVELEVQCLSDPAACGPPGEQLPTDPNRPVGGSSVPFDQVFGDYRDAAFEALPGSNIPPALQGLVRDYFTALEP